MINKGKYMTEKMKAAFQKAVTNPDNLNQDGSINWNFVDADVYHEVDPDETTVHYNKFHMLCNSFKL